MTKLSPKPSTKIEKKVKVACVYNDERLYQPGFAVSLKKIESQEANSVTQEVGTQYLLEE